MPETVMDVFGGAPRVLAYPRPLVVQSGTDATLTCKIGANPQPEVVWERNGQQIKLGGRYHPSENGNVYTLTISAATKDDEGQYVCKVRNSVGETYAAATLRVEPETLSTTVRQENKAENKDNVDAGEMHVVHTVATQRPEKTEEKDNVDAGDMHVVHKVATQSPEKTEDKDNVDDGEMHVVHRVATQRSEKTEDKDNVDDGDVHVVHTVATQRQEKTLEPNVDNLVTKTESRTMETHKEHTTGNQKVNMKVSGEMEETHKEMVRDIASDKGRPRFLIRPLSARVRSGDDVLFSCKIWGSPQPEVVWEKDGRPLKDIFESAHFSTSTQEGDWFQLRLGATRVPDGGVFTCKARNQYGEALAGAMLLVDGPRVEEEDGQGTHNGYRQAHQEYKRDSSHYPSPLPSSTKVKRFAVTEGKHAKLRCFVTGKPKPEIVWQKDGLFVFAGRRHLLYEDREGYFTLKVLYCRQQDNGVYVCFASNMAGHTLSAVQLIVKETEVQFQMPLCDVEVQEQDLAVLECEVPEASVPTSWFLEDRRLQTGNKYNIEECGRRRRLTIRDVGADDDGIYFCEMANGGRSIAEVAVKGTIVRKLPRRLEVLEGENAVFCVEVHEPEMETKWYRDGFPLRENHQTIIKCFGKTHILVLINTTIEDSGVVTFIVGRSKSSSKLRVKAARHSAPSCPTNAKLAQGHGNVAILSWCPARDLFSQVQYVVERQEVGSQEWQLCLTTDSAESVEISGDVVPREADYLFRIRSVNKYGKSSHVEFPGAVHLAPVVKIQAPLQDVVVLKNQDACFTIDLSHIVTGAWFLNGAKLQESECICINHSGTQHSLTIRGVQASEDGSEITFTATGIRNSASIHIKGPAKFKPLSEMDSCKIVKTKDPIVLYCELSDADASVHWYKDEVEIHSEDGVLIQSEENMRRIIIESAEVSHSGVYSCDTGDDVIKFNVNVQATKSFLELPEKKNSTVKAGGPIVLQCELTNPEDLVCWYKDGIKLLPQGRADIQSEGTVRRLVIQSASPSDSGVYTCHVNDDVVSFKVEVQAPPVKFSSISKEDLHKNVVELDPIVLHCEVSNPDVTVQWYKDGMEIQPNNNIIVQAKGYMRRLIIQSAQHSNSGTYTCQTADNQLQFQVKVREPPVMIVDPKDDMQLNLHVSEEIVLSCELSRSSGVVNWYKDGEKLKESEKTSMTCEGPYRRLRISPANLDDSGEYVCNTADDSVFFLLNISEAPVKFICPKHSHVELCQKAADAVILSCEISRAEAEVRWYRNGLQVEESENLFLEVDGAHRKLVIPDASVQDSAEYVCETADDAITFVVSITEPPVKFDHSSIALRTLESLAGEPLVLECKVSSPNSWVNWKKDGKDIEDSDAISISQEGVMHQLTIPLPTLENSGIYSCHSKDDTIDFEVHIKELPVKILRKSQMKTELKWVESDDAELECELSRPDAAVTWYKDGQKIMENDRLIFEEDGAFRSLVILNAEIGDSAEYLCDARDDSVVFHVTVQEPPVFILSKSESQEMHNLVSGDDLILACEVSRASAPVKWFCNDRLLSSDSRTFVQSHGTVRKLIIQGVRPSDSGIYTCDTGDDKMVTIVKVQEMVVQFLNNQEKNVVIGYERESITLTAKVSPGNAVVQWLKDWTQVTGERFLVANEGNARSLTVEPLQRSDSGEYTCDAKTEQMHFSLLVKEMRVKFVKPLEDMIAHRDGLVTLRCELTKARGDVLWLKDGKEIIPSRRFSIRADGCERTLTIHRLTLEDAGEFVCESKDDRTAATLIVKKPRVVEFLADLHSTTVLEGEDATFKCVVSPEDVWLVWLRDGEPIHSDNRLTVCRNGLCHTLQIHRCSLSDSCQVTVEAEGLVSKANLKVQEAQVLFTKKMETVVAEEYSDATLEVEVNVVSGEVQWIRQGVVIQSGPKFTLSHDGRKQRLTVHNLGISDRGTYRCETLHDRTQGKLMVEPRKITLSKGLSDVETFEHETATFEVLLSHDEVEGVWQRDGIRLKPNNQWRISAKGRLHSLTLPNLTLQDSGTISFSAESAKTMARLTVKEPPVTFLKKPKDLSFLEGTQVTIDCELTRQNAEVKWFKNGVELKPGPNHCIYSMGRKRFLQILKCSLMDSATYTCDAGDANVSCNLEIYEREVEIVQPLDDLDIQENENAVFMCEVSREDVTGEWYQDDKRIRPSSTIKIRQEGTKHFLLMCNVKPEDSGEIKFVAKYAETVAYLEVEELPVTIVKPLRDRTALEGHKVILECTTSSPRCSVCWFCGSTEILPSERFEISSDGCYHKLVIHQLCLEDEGSYSVKIGEHKSSATLLVEAQSLLMVKELEDVEVMAPEEACFECELSVLPTKPPVWSLNGEALRHSPETRMETHGTVYRLRLHPTAADMSGLVHFTVGKAKSTASLCVKNVQS